jgi:fructoselysine 6-kinase
MRLACVGDNVVDRYPDLGLMFPGGNAVNVAVFAHQCGAETAYVGVLGDDAAGVLLLDALREEGVDVSAIMVAHGPNGWTDIRLVEGNRIFEAWDDGVSRFDLSEDDLAWLARFDAVHTGDSGFVEHRVPEIARHTPTSFDFSKEREPNYVEPLLEHLFLATFSAGDLSAPETEQLLSWACSRRARFALATRGRLGAVMSDGRRVWHQATLPIPTVVDTLGAGDAFIARTLVGLLGGEDPQRTLAEAAALAASVCGYHGAFGHPRAYGAESGNDKSIEFATSIPGLILSRLSGDHVEAYYNLIERNRDHLTAHGDYQEMRKARLRSIAEELKKEPDDGITFGVWLGDALIGRVDLASREAGNFVLGFWLDHEHTGHGYATASCAALIDYGRSILGATDVWAGVTKGNTASERVLERLRFERVADMGTYTRFHRSLRT